MDYFINGQLHAFPNMPIEELEAKYNQERLKRKVHRKGPAPKLLGNERCTICGQWANGFHYNVLSCEGCKGFFRRTIINGLEYTCKDGKGNCDLFNAGIRQRCQKCRIMRCLQAGMKANFVQKRKEEHSPGPYEPPAQKIPRKSVIIQKIPNDLDYLRQSLERPWREVHEIPCNWDGIRDQDDISQYMHAIKGHIINKFLLQLPFLQQLPVALQQEICMNCINELLVLYLSKSYCPLTESFEINNQQISRKSLSSQYGVDFDLSQKIFLFFSKQSKTIKTYNQNDLFAIIAGIITFSPDRRYNLSQHAQNENLSYEVDGFLAKLTDLQDKCYNLLDVYLERYNSLDNHVSREITRWMTLLREINHEVEAFNWSQTFRKLKSNPNFHHLLSGSQQFINSVIKPQNAVNNTSQSVSPSPNSVNSMSHISESSSNCSRSSSSTVIKINPSNPPSPGGSSRTSSGSPRLLVIEDDIKIEP